MTTDDEFGHATKPSPLDPSRITTRGEKLMRSERVSNATGNNSTSTNTHAAVHQENRAETITESREHNQYKRTARTICGDDCTLCGADRRREAKRAIVLLIVLIAGVLAAASWGHP